MCKQKREKEDANFSEGAEQSLHSWQTFLLVRIGRRRCYSTDYITIWKLNKEIWVASVIIGNADSFIDSVQRR